MSLLGRFLGSGRGNAYAEGVSLLEEGRFAEAADRLRLVALGRSESVSGSLAAYHFRQALVAEGRRLLRLDQANEAAEVLAETVRHWDLYPDLHCLYGTALAMSGDYDRALREARFALRLNFDYVEARLLEAVVLQALEHERQAADSLNSMLETGRRVDHWLIDHFQSPDQYVSGQLPDDMLPQLVKSLSGESEKEEVAAAVSLCRAGQWLESREIFSSLVARRPRYPDYRTRHAAVLFQLGQSQEALEEVDAALALNENYRTAIDLKGLILADTGRLLEARDFLQDADDRLEEPASAGAHEQLFGAYLRGALALLSGQTAAVATILEPWPDLVRTFARAELLLAAADELQGRSPTSGRRLADLADQWPDEAIYFDLLACHHLQQHRYRDADAVLSRWPEETQDSGRYRYLVTLLDLCRGREPRVPLVVPENKVDDISPPAWQFLVGRAAFQAGDDQEAWRICTSLGQQGMSSERLVRLQIAAATGKGVLADEGWEPPSVLPDSCLAAWVFFEVNRGNHQPMVDYLDRVLELHPECLVGRWLHPRFWLAPIRSWIA